MLVRLFLTAAILIVGVSSKAETQGEFCSQNGYIVEYICGAEPSGPGWVQAQDGCWYLATQRPCQQSPQPPPYPQPQPTPQPPPYPGPGPGPAPYPPPYPPAPYPPHSQYVRCESYGYGYAECFLGRGVRRVTLARQWSAEPCIAYQTFGATTDRMWVNRGCRGDFFVEYY